MIKPHLNSAFSVSVQAVFLYYQPLLRMVSLKVEVVHSNLKPTLNIGVLLGHSRH